MSLVDQHFKDALKKLPTKKLSWQADRRIKGLIRQRVKEMQGSPLPFWRTLQRMIAVPVALALVLVSTAGYAHSSPSVAQGDLLYPIKSELENWFYPDGGTSEERVAYHLWLSDRRFDEAKELLSRRTSGAVASVVYAQQEGESATIDDFIVKTLKAASQHVEYAFLLSDEVREVERVENIKGQIRQTIENQKGVLQEISPALKEVKLSRKERARASQLRQARLNAQAELQLLAEVSRDSLEEDADVEVSQQTESQMDPANTDLPVGGGLEEFTENTGTNEMARSMPQKESIIENDQDDDLSSEGGDDVMAPKLLLQEEGVLEEEPEEEIDDVEAFLTDRLAFQEQLLEEVEQKVEVAKAQKSVAVELNVEKVLDTSPDQDPVVDRLFVQALEVHYQNKQQLIKKDLEDLDREYIAQVPFQPIEGSGDAALPQIESYREPQDEPSSDTYDTQAQQAEVNVNAVQEDQPPFATNPVGETPEVPEFPEEEVEQEQTQIASLEAETDGEVEAGIAADEDVDADNQADQTEDSQSENDDSLIALQRESDLSSDESATPSLAMPTPETSALMADESQDGEVMDQSVETNIADDDQAEGDLEGEEVSTLQQQCMEAVRKLCSQYDNEMCEFDGQQYCQFVENESEIEAQLRIQQEQLELWQQEQERKQLLESQLLQKETELIELDQKIQSLEQKKLDL